jgi:23S rRNA (guanosine2251-2'-O)-methyltransferase
MTKPPRPPQRFSKYSTPKPVPRPDRDHPPPSRKPDPANDLIHGVHAVVEAIKNPKRKIVHLWASENGFNRLKEAVVNADLTAEILHPRHLDHMLVGQDAVHQGLILEAAPLHQPRLDQVSRDGVIVLLDQVTDPHNVGAILRSCAAFGVSALVSPARHTAATSGTLFKAASGAFEHVPMVTVTNLGRAMDELKAYGFHIVGLDSDAEIDMDNVAKARPLALVLGAEGKGLRQLTRDTCDEVARLSMPGTIKSLNVSIATAVSLYALTR